MNSKKYNYHRKSFVFDGLEYTVRGKTEKEAILKRDELWRKLECGEYVRQHAKDRDDPSLSENMTVNEYANFWMETYIFPKVRSGGSAKKKHTMTQKQYNMYDQKLRLYILPMIGKKRLKAVKDYHLQEILNKQKKDGLSESHANKVRMIIR